MVLVNTYVSPGKQIHCKSHFTAGISKAKQLKEHYQYEPLSTDPQTPLPHTRVPPVALLLITLWLFVPVKPWGSCVQIFHSRKEGWRCRSQSCPGEGWLLVTSKRVCSVTRGVHWGTVG